MKGFSKNFLWAIVSLVSIALVFSALFNSDFSAKTERLSLNELVRRINAGEVKNIEVSGDELAITLQGDKKAVSQKEAEAGLSETLANYGVKPEALSLVDITMKEESGFRFWMGILLPSLLPVLLLVLLFSWFFRQAKGGMNQAFTFGKANLKLFAHTKDKVTFKDVAGLKEAKEELEEVVDFLKNPKKFLDMGARIPRGVLLVGPPGTGKTLMARAVAGQSNVPFFHMSASEFVEMFVGVGASVTGDTPVLIRERGSTRLLSIGEFVDKHYKENETDCVKRISGVQALGFKPLESGFWGSRSNEKKFFGGSRWSNVSSVYRHKASEIYEIHYLGGILRTTGDHSVFVRERNMVRAKKASELKEGESLVNLPFKVRSSFVPGVGTTHKVRAHEFFDTASLELELFDEKLKETTRAYQFALSNREIMSQSAIAFSVGVSQATVKNWQLGYHEPRFFHATVFTSDTPSKISVTPELMRLFGYYTAEGRTTEYFTEFTFGKHETNLHEDCVRLVQEIFSLVPATRFGEDNTFKIRIDSPYIARFFERHCGTGSHHKHAPEFIWDLPREHFLQYLYGYSEGDGYTTQEEKLCMTSVSRRLILELAWLCSMHGIQVGVGISVTPGGRVIKNKPLPETTAWKLTIGKTSHPFAGKHSFPYQWKKPKITKIIRKPYDGYVYDLCGCDNEAFFGGEKPTLLHNSRVRDLFLTAKKAAPSLVFVDEIDAVGRERGAGLGGGHDEREQTLNQILVEMDGFDRDTNVIVICATNRPDILDPALLRPGRFDRRVILDMPDIADREEILKIHAAGKPFAEGVDLHAIAVRTPGFSGADLANLMNESALWAARHDRKQITQIDIIDSIEKVMLGPARRSRKVSEHEKEVTAYHEAGHALVAAALKDTDPVQKVSIVSRGLAGGYTIKLPLEEKRLKTKAQFLAELAVAFGGYVAELVKFKEVTTGSSSDISQATRIAHRIVTRYGMSDVLGPRTFGKSQELIFLGREISTEKDYSEEVATKIDSEVNALIQTALSAAKKIISAHKAALEKIAKTLIEKESLEHEEFYKIVGEFGLKPIRIS